MAPSAVEVPVPLAKSIVATNGLSTREELKSPASPLPEVKTFDAEAATVDELVDALRIAGGLVIRNVLNKDELASLEKDIRPELEKDTAWGDGTFGVDCFPLGQCLSAVTSGCLLRAEFTPALPCYQGQTGQ